MSHDLEDHGWQFHSHCQSTMEDVMLVSLESVVNIDPSICKVAHILPGYNASRDTVESEWNISKTEEK